jgi:hypothetical protein
MCLLVIYPKTILHKRVYEHTRTMKWKTTGQVGGGFSWKLYTVGRAIPLSNVDGAGRPVCRLGENECYIGV